MSGVIATIPKYQFSAADGTPLAAGTLTTYLAGTTTLSNTWQDSALTSANTNPITLDSRGECVLWLDSTKSYKFVLKNSAGVTQWTVDNINTDNNIFTTIQVTQSTTTSSDYATGQFRRNTSHTGGTPGNVSSCLRADTYVLAGGVSNYEWAITGVVDNNATSGQNVGGYFQGKKNSTGPTWGAVAEVIETTAVNNPTTGAVGLEVDVSCNGTDTLGNRVGVDLVLRKYASGGVDAASGWGYRIQNGGDSNSLVNVGFGFAAGMRAAVGFDTSAGTMVTAAFRMADSQPIAFTAASTRKMFYTASSGAAFKLTDASNNTLWGFKDNGALVTGTAETQIIGGRVTGFTAMTGTNDGSSAFAVSTVTLAQLASRVNALQTALTTHGLIGA